MLHKYKRLIYWNHKIQNTVKIIPIYNSIRAYFYVHFQSIYLEISHQDNKENYLHV